MFQTSALCTAATHPTSRHTGRPGQRLALLTGMALLAALTTIPRPPTPATAGLDGTAGRPAAKLVLAPGAGLPTLQAAAEALRARLLTVPGVGSVRLDGLRTAGLEVQYAPSRLLRLGVREADIEAAVPTDARQTAPGRLPVRADAAQAGLAAIADLPVHAGRLVLRLGDMAAVVRTKLPAPVSTASWDGRAAVSLTVTPAPGAAGGALERRVAASVASAQVPAGVGLIF